MNKLYIDIEDNFNFPLFNDYINYTEVIERCEDEIISWINSKDITALREFCFDNLDLDETYNKEIEISFTDDNRGVNIYYTFTEYRVDSDYDSDGEEYFFDTEEEYTAVIYILINETK